MDVRLRCGYSLHFNGHLPGGSGLASTKMSSFWLLLQLRMMKVVVLTCKAPVKSSPPTNQYPVFYRPDALPVAKPTVSKHWRLLWNINYWYASNPLHVSQWWVWCWQLSFVCNKLSHGVLASEGWWEAWQPSTKVSRSLVMVKDKFWYSVTLLAEVQTRRKLHIYIVLIGNVSISIYFVQKCNNTSNSNDTWTGQLE